MGGQYGRRWTEKQYAQSCGRETGKKKTLWKAGCKGKNNVKMDFVISWLQ